MRGVLKRRERTAQVTVKPAQADAAAVAPAASPGAASGADAAASRCGLLTCLHCGLTLEILTLRCPRCRADIPLGCAGNCSMCGKA